MHCSAQPLGGHNEDAVNAQGNLQRPTCDLASVGLELHNDVGCNNVGIQLGLEVQLGSLGPPLRHDGHSANKLYVMLLG